MIEIHAHILPELDDGVQTLQESLLLGIEYQKAGFSSIVATPHIKDGEYTNNLENITTSVEVLNIEFALGGLTIDVYSGAEYYMDIRILKDLQKGSIVTLGDSEYVLIEFPQYQIPKYAKTIISILRKSGYTPVLAHPERCKAITPRNTNLINWYVDRGCKLQINVHDLLGNNGKIIMKVAWDFFENGLISFIGMDAHTFIPVGKAINKLKSKFIAKGKETFLKEVLNVEHFFIKKHRSEIRK